MMNGQSDNLSRFLSDLHRIFNGDGGLGKEDELALREQFRMVMEAEYKQKMASQWYHDAKLRG